MCFFSNKKEVEELNAQIVKLKKDIEDYKQQVKELKLLIDTNPPIKEPKRLATLTSLEVYTALQPHVSSLSIVHCTDKTYGATSVTEAKKFSNETKIQAREWIEEKYDCDEFSFALMGYWNDGLEQFAFGIAWSATHAFNIMVDNNKQVWVVEPQSNKFIKIEDIKNDTSYYPFQMVMF